MNLFYLTLDRIIPSRSHHFSIHISDAVTITGMPSCKSIIVLALLYRLRKKKLTAYSYCYTRYNFFQLFYKHEQQQAALQKKTSTAHFTSK